MYELYRSNSSFASSNASIIEQGEGSALPRWASSQGFVGDRGSAPSQSPPYPRSHGDVEEHQGADPLVALLLVPLEVRRGPLPCTPINRSPPTGLFATFSGFW